MEFVHYNTAKLAKERRKKAIMEQAEFTMILRAVYIPKLIVKVLGTFPILAAMLLYRKNLVSG